MRAKGNVPRRRSVRLAPGSFWSLDGVALDRLPSAVLVAKLERRHNLGIGQNSSTPISCDLEGLNDCGSRPINPNVKKELVSQSTARRTRNDGEIELLVTLRFGVENGGVSLHGPNLGVATNIDSANRLRILPLDICSKIGIAKLQTITKSGVERRLIGHPLPDGSTLPSMSSLKSELSCQ